MKKVLISAATAAGIVTAIIIGRPTGDCVPALVHCGNVEIAAQLCGTVLVLPPSVLRMRAREFHECRFGDGRPFSILDGGLP